MAKKRVKRKRLNFKALFILLLVLYLIIVFLYTLFTMPIKNIYIKNTNLISDNEIIEVAGIKDYPAIIKLSKKSLEKKIKTIELVNNVTVKKTLTGKLIIDIEEAVPIFYNRNTRKVVLSNGLEVENNSNYLGVPTLINYVPSELLNEFVSSLKNIDSDILKMINEIEYDPDISENVVIDDERFLLRMNDTNLVYINVLNMERLDDYKEFFAIIGDARGILYLDSYDSSNDLLGLFTPFENIDEEIDNIAGESSEVSGED